MKISEIHAMSIIDPKINKPRLKVRELEEALRLRGFPRWNPSYYRFILKIQPPKDSPRKPNHPRRRKDS